jgi:peptidyl-prolyl cis-trans isomerase C
LTKATEADRAKAKLVGETNYNEYVKGVPDEADFRRRIMAFGMTVDQFRDRIVEEAIFREVIDREIRAKITISTEQARQFYLTNAAQYDEPEKVRASHIVFLTEDPKTHVSLSEAQKQEKRQLAEKVLARLKAGEDFAKVAKETSEDPITRDKGGALPVPFARGKLMVPEIDEAAFALKANQISDLVQTKAGYHILKVFEKISARHVPFEEVEGKIKEYLSIQATQEQLPAYLKKLRAESNVEILEPPKR